MEIKYDTNEIISTSEKNDERKALNENIYISLEKHTNNLIESDNRLANELNKLNRNSKAFKGDFDFTKELLFESSNKIQSELNKMYSQISYIQQLIGEYKSDNNLATADPEFIKNTQFSFNNDVLHIIYPSLLPKKLKNNKDIGIETKRITDSYTAAIHDYFKKHQSKIYNEKVILCFIHHYESELAVRDHDNYSLREIINALCTYVLTDDNPKWCAHYTDYRLSDKNYSEIYVIPDSKKDIINQI